MDLILWRHAHAHRAIDPEPDLARALTAKGIQNAARMARWLGRRLPKNVRILCSPAVRAEQTVQSLQRPYQLCEATEPGAGVDALSRLVGDPQSKGTLLLVGHQPDLGRFAAHLMGLGDIALDMPKASIWWLRSRPNQAELRFHIISVMSPKQL